MYVCTHVMNVRRCYIYIYIYIMAITFTTLVGLDRALPTCGASLSQLKRPFSNSSSFLVCMCFFFFYFSTVLLN